MKQHDKFQSMGGTRKKSGGGFTPDDTEDDQEQPFEE